MTKSKKNPRIDAVLSKAKKWRKELEKLRMIILGCGLTEEMKWGKPCYTVQGKNLIMIYGLKESCAIAFFNGALLKDEQRILIKPGPNTQAGRWIKFTSLREIVEKAPVLKAYIRQSIQAEKSGLEVTYKKPSEFIIPEEVQKKLDAIPALKTAFHALTPGRQRGYILYFSAPKQSKTRESRVEKCMPQILKGKGINDR
jgi:uncharacterized protein YdeI (YjbR/CyaY-like superfamily)